MCVGTYQDLIDSLWSKTIQMLSWDKPIVMNLKSDPNLKEELVINFKKKKLYGDDEVLYNWFIGTAFGICINDLKRL